MQFFDPIFHDLRDERARTPTEGPAPRVRAWMTSPVHVCAGSSSAAAALQRMRTHNVTALPVLDDAQRVAGLVTDRDVAFAVLGRGELPEVIPVGQVMTRPVVTVGGDEPLSRALALMAEHRVRRVPVVDDEGHPIGMVSLSDLVRAASVRARGLDGAALANAVGLLARRPIG